MPTHVCLHTVYMVDKVMSLFPAFWHRSTEASARHLHCQTAQANHFYWIPMHSGAAQQQQQSSHKINKSKQTNTKKNMMAMKIDRMLKTNPPTIKLNI